MSRDRRMPKSLLCTPAVDPVQGVGDPSVTLGRGVLVDERRAHARVPHPMHELARTGATRRREVVARMTPVVQVQAQGAGPPRPGGSPYRRPARLVRVSPHFPTNNRPSPPSSQHLTLTSGRSQVQTRLASCAARPTTVTSCCGSRKPKHHPARCPNHSDPYPRHHVVRLHDRLGTGCQRCTMSRVGVVDVHGGY
ncbi:MAG: hypothetical protein K0R30_2760 [Ornithinibacter sp.]|nr:hypothetical protein [Ornithinibacter sp.]